MKNYLIIILSLLSITLMGQSDEYGNYFNISYMVPAPKGNGTTDDRVIILKALQQYKSVFIPYTAKGYKIEGNLNIPAGCRLIFDVGARFVGSGTIIGSATQIVGQGTIFAATLSFGGSFSCPYVNAGWFGSEADYNAFALLTSLPALYAIVDSTSLSGIEADPIWAADSAEFARRTYVQDMIVDSSLYPHPDSIILHQGATFTATSAFKFPTLAAEQPSDGSDWADSSNVYSSNNVYASTYNSNDCSDYLKINDFEFTIPTDAIITGITVDMEAKCDSGNFYLDRIYVLKNDAAVAGVWVTPGSWVLPLTDTILSTDSSNFVVINSMWGTTWTPAQINDSLFGLNIRFCNDSVQSDTLRLDYVKVTISYNMPNLLASTTKITPYGVAVDGERYLLPSDAWETIDTAGGDLDMNGSHINNIWTLSAENINIEKRIFFVQEEHRPGVVNEVDTIDWGVRNVYSMILDDTCQITFLTPTYPCFLQLIIMKDNTATEYPVTFSNTIKWKGGTPYSSSTSANAIDIIGIYFDDTNYYGIPGNDFK